MQSIADQMMANFTRNAKKTGGVRCEWQEAVERAMGTIDNKDWKSQKPWTFARWCAYLRGIPTDKVHSMLALALKSTKPGAHFNFLVKLYREEARKTLQAK